MTYNSITPSLSAEDLYLALFNALPGSSMLLKNDAPTFTILAATTQYQKDTSRDKDDLIGKGIFEAFPSNPFDPTDTGERDLRASLTMVHLNKMPHQLPMQRYDLRNNDGSFTEHYWQAENNPILTPGGEVAYIIHTVENITAQIKSQQQAVKLKGMEQAHNIFLQAPVVIGIMRGEDHVLELANEDALKLWGKTNAIIGKPLLEAIPELEGQEPYLKIDQVFKTGQLYQATEVPVISIKEGREVVHYFDLYYKPFYDEGSSTVSGVFTLSTDVTDKVVAQRKVLESEQDLRTMVLQAPIGICVMDAATLVSQIANAAFVEIAGKPLDEIVGCRYWDTFAEARPYYESALNQVVQTGITYYANEVEVPLIRHGRREVVHVTFVYEPLKDTEGNVKKVVVWVVDNTPQVLARRTIEESEARFRSLADQSPMFVYMVEPDAEARMSYFNKTWLQYTGQSFEEALGRAWDGIVHPEEVQGVLDIYVPAFQNKQPYTLPAVRIRRHDGQYRWHLFKGTPRYLPTGEFMGYVGVGIDIHEQKLATEALKESEARSKAAIDIARLGTYEINVLEQSIIHSPRTAEILGLDPAKQWPHQTFIETLLPEDSEIRGKAIEEAKETGELFYEARIIHPDQNIRWVRLNGRYIQQDSQPIIIGILMDITDEKKAAEVLERMVEKRTRELEEANQALLRSNQELARSNANLEEFAHAASHDMKEPIRKVLTFTDRLKTSMGSRMTDVEKQLFSRVENATQRMGLLVDDLLEFSHVSERPLEKETVDLNVKVERVLTDLELLIEEKRARINVGILPTVKGYKRQLQQLLQNIIGNALKYSKPDLAPVITIISKEIHGNEVASHVLPEQLGQRFHLIEVKDNGIGFEQEYAEKIFQMFQRLHGKAEYPGTGVGLSIARKVVENHNGYVWAESQPGEGATFKILLPADS